MLLISLVCLWLTICAVQDYNCRQVSNRLTFPILAAALVYRLTLFSMSFLGLLALVSGLLYLSWQKGWLGGADFKASLALLLVDPGLLLYAYCGVLVSYLGLSICKSPQVTRTIPAFNGFALGSYIYFLMRIIYE